MKLLIRNAKILTMRNEEIIEGDILIENDTIKKIGVVDESADEYIDVKGNIVMPGLINSHTHIAMSLLRNYADDLPFWPWLLEKILPAEENLTKESVYWGSMLSIAEMIASGTTTFCDMYFFTEQTIEAVQNTGIRANISRGLASGKDEDAKLRNGLELFKLFNGSENNRIKIDFGPHAPYTCNLEYLKKINLQAEKIDINIHIHLSESKKEVEDSIEKYNKSPIEYVHESGLFSNNTIAAHCVHVDDNDINILAKNNVNVVNNPSSNLKLANGFAPVYKMMKNGINVCLGTDGPASNNNQDMFEEMHIAAILNKSVESDSTVLPAFEVLKMATINGAKTLGIDNLVGTLEVGKKADMIVIDLDKPHMYPRHNFLSALVYSASGSDVATVIVDGKVLYKDYKFIKLNLKEIYKNAEKESQLLAGGKKRDAK